MKTAIATLLVLMCSLMAQGQETDSAGFKFQSATILIGTHFTPTSSGLEFTTMGIGLDFVNDLWVVSPHFLFGSGAIHPFAGSPPEQMLDIGMTGGVRYQIQQLLYSLTVGPSFLRTVHQLDVIGGGWFSPVYSTETRKSIGAHLVFDGSYQVGDHFLFGLSAQGAISTKDKILSAFISLEYKI